MKYAVVGSGGKQYVAREGETIQVDRLPQDVGKNIEFKDVFLIVDGTKVDVGKPTVKGAVVKGKVVEQVKARKVLVFKYIPKERYRRRKGHRQRYTRVEIKSIAKAAPKAKQSAKAEAPAEAKKAAGSKRKAKPAAKEAKSTAKAKPAAKKASTGTKTKKTESNKKAAKKSDKAS